MQWEIVAQTNVGKVRKKNEDAHLVVKQIPLLVVADGMGGMAAGDMASGKIVDELSLIDCSASTAQLEASVTQALQRAHQDILNYSRESLEGSRAGSTVVLLALEETGGFCFWVGDSRLYRIRNHTLTQLTSDHSQVNEMLKQGLLTAEQAKTASFKNILTHAVGVHDDLYMERVGIESQPGDTYLLCSDGLYNEIEESELLHILNGNDIYRISVQLSNLCLRRGARDNFTFIICRSRDGVVTQTDSEDTQISVSAGEQTQLEHRGDMP